MTLRFSEGDIRFRVMTSELDALIAGKTLTLISFPITAEIRAKELSGSKKFSLRAEGAQLWVEISKKELELLTSKLPSREGIDEVIILNSGTELSVSFEVDIKSKQGNL